VSPCITIRSKGVQRCALTTTPASDLHISLKEGKFEWPASFPKNKFARTYSWTPKQLNLLNFLNFLNHFNPFNPFNPFNCPKARSTFLEYIDKIHIFVNQKH
jgi:hypothetical protein